MFFACTFPVSLTQVVYDTNVLFVVLFWLENLNFGSVLASSPSLTRTQESSPKLPHRVHSQREFDRRILPEVAQLRPSSAQDIHSPVTQPPPGYQGSLSLTETCV